MKSCPLIPPTTPTNQETSQMDPRASFSSFENAQARELDLRTRQDSVTPSSPTKPLARVPAGLIPDHSFDTWTATWETAYDATHFANPPSPSPGITRSFTVPALSSKKRTRPPLTGRLSVTDAEIKKFVFGDREDSKRGFRGPEEFLVPEKERRGSEVPSLVRSEGSCGSGGLENLEEGSEGEGEGKVEVELESDEKTKGRVFVRDAEVFSEGDVLVV
ncbi:hypothetical protein E4T42_05182 [Aureobasidium subglaciale]|nr:hypothetical protein E4T42_05182 [Aureobasidium subglaciale]